MSAGCLDEERLQTFLEGALSGGDALAVEAHVDRCGACRQLIAELGRALTATARSLPPVSVLGDPKSLPPGTIIGRYQILEVLGVGAMGVVYAARDPELDRKVALKLVAGPHGGEKRNARARVQREAKAIARLAHPNVVSVFDVGTHGDDVFIAMEHVDGGTVRAALQARHHSWREVVALFLQAGRGLAAAHAQGLVHRDFKPDNVLIGTDGRPRVCDFGLAAALQIDTAPESQTTALEPPAPLAATVTRTRTGTVLGTPAYMAPEQMRGERADARSDEFSFSVALYEALYGARPFGGRTLDELRTATERGAIAEPSAGPDVPRWLRACVLRGLRPAPADRYATMDEMLRAIELGMRDTPARRGGPLAAGAAVLAFAGVVASALVAWQRKEPAAQAAPERRSQGAVEAPAFSFDTTNVRRLTFNGGCDEDPAFTPDGRFVLFDETLDADPFLVVMDLSDRSTRRLTQPPTYDFEASISFDGASFAYQASKRKERSGVYVGRMDGSSGPRFVAPKLAHPRFSRDGRSLWVDDRSRIHRVDIETGAVLETLDPPVGMLPARTIELAGGALLAQFAHFVDASTGGVAIYGADRSVRTLFTGDLDEALAVTPDGRYALVTRTRTAAQPELLAVPLDGGPAVSLASSGVAPWRGIAIAPDGGSVVWSTCHGRTTIGVLQGDGTLRPYGSNPEEWNDHALAWIAGTTRIVVLSARGGRVAPWVVDLAGTTPPRRLDLVGDTNDATYVAVSPDGKTLAVSVDEKGIYVAPLLDSAAATLRVGGTGLGGLSFLRDGQTLLYATRADGHSPRVMKVHVGGGEPEPLLENAEAPSASPDGDLVVYLDGPSRTSVTPRLYSLSTKVTRPLSRKLEAKGYRSPHFSPDGKRVGLLDGGRRVLEIDVASGNVLRDLETADELFRCDYVQNDVMCGRGQWLGGLWMADIAR